MINSQDTILDDFQKHSSDGVFPADDIIELLTKYQESSSKVCRAIAKCNSHCKNGSELCENCKFSMEKEIGRNLFYLSSICNKYNLKLTEIVAHEINIIDILGKYISI